jgi:hypothetical protein
MSVYGGKNSTERVKPGPGITVGFYVKNSSTTAFAVTVDQ